MSNVPGETGNQDAPFVGKGCPKCGYDLTGTPEPRCPECGAAFEPAELKPVGIRRRLCWRVSIVVTLLAMYLPNTWVFWIDYPWNSYRMTWVKLFPAMPALFPAVWLFYLTELGDKFGDKLLFTMAGMITLLAVISCAVLGRRSRRWLIPIAIALFALEVVNASILHSWFRM